MSCVLLQGTYKINLYLRRNLMRLTKIIMVLIGWRIVMRIGSPS